MFKTATIALILLTFAGAAEGDYQGHLKATYYSVDDLSQSLTQAQGFDSNVLQSCNCRLSQITIPDPACAKRYQNLFQHKTLKFKLAFGYIDLTPADYSMDPIYAAALKDILRRPCPPNAEARGVFLCGFIEDPQDNERFVKRGLPGPDGRLHNVEMTVVNSSKTIELAENRALGWRQTEQSMHAKETFFGSPQTHDGFCGTDVAMFLGHFRLGCGPGFFLPPFKGSGIHKDVDYAAECATQGSFPDLKKSLAKCQPKLLSTFACSYKNARELYNQYPSMGYQRPKVFAFFPDWAYQVYGTLNGLLGQVCEPQLSQMINPKGAIDPRGEMTFTHF